MLPKDAESNSALLGGDHPYGNMPRGKPSAAQSGCPHILQDIPVGPSEDCGDRIESVLPEQHQDQTQNSDTKVL